MANQQVSELYHGSSRTERHVVYTLAVQMSVLDIACTDTTTVRTTNSCASKVLCVTDGKHHDKATRVICQRTTAGSTVPEYQHTLITCLYKIGIFWYA